MGRFEAWTDRVMNGAPRRRRCLAGGALRRPLRFEQFESRLALSAAVQTDFGAADSIMPAGQMLHTLWEATPGSSQWGDVTFAAPQVLLPVGDTLALSLRSEPVSPQSLNIEHGGFIAFDGVLSLWGMRNQTMAFAADLDGPAGRGAFRLDNYVLDAEPLIDSSAGGIAIDAAPSGFEPSWSEGVKPPFDIGDGLLGTGSGGNLSGGDEANVTLIESPVLRITAPLADADDEGGAIDVTAMVAPRAFVAAHHASTLATDGVRPGTRALSQREASSRRVDTAADADGDELRARAVVYEVALARELKDEAPEKTRAQRKTPASPDVPSAPTTPQGDNRAAMPASRDANGEIAADAAAPNAADGAPATSQQTSSLEAHPAEQHTLRVAVAARDAALARFEDQLSERPTADLETASSRNQSLGMALALAVGAGPLLRRMRRSKGTCPEGRAAGLD